MQCRDQTVRTVQVPLMTRVMVVNCGGLSFNGSDAAAATTLSGQGGQAGGAALTGGCAALSVVTAMGEPDTRAGMVALNGDRPTLNKGNAAFNERVVLGQTCCRRGRVWMPWHY